MSVSLPDPLRRYGAAVVLGAIGPLLALQFGGYHPRHVGWVVLLLGAWACVVAAAGRLPAPRSLAGIGSAALVLLTAWTTASIGWADASHHDAWVEALRALGYAAAFLLGSVLLASHRAIRRTAAVAGAGIGLVGAVTVVRMLGDAPLRTFVSGRLDWPLGYAPGIAGFYLVGAFLLLGAAGSADRVWARERTTIALAGGGLAFAGTAICAALAVLAQSRGTIPALAVGLVLVLVATPQRGTLVARLGVLATLLLVLRARLAEPFQTQFDWRQAPFVEGADQTALLHVAEQSARSTAGAIAAAVVVAGLVGAALVPTGDLIGRVGTGTRRRRIGTSAWTPVAVLVAAAVVTLGLLQAAPWAAKQWDGCLHPPVQTNDPGSSSSYFATAGTGRCDYYRVALDNAREHPLMGTGAGNFRSQYVLKRRTAEDPRVAHSLPLQLLGELGVVGALLGATVLAVVLLAAWRFVRSGPDRSMGVAGAIAALAYWVTHASIDWMWQLPAVSLPVVVLAGGLVGSCSTQFRLEIRRAVAVPVAAGALLVVVCIALPVTMADRDLRQARDPETQRRSMADAVAAARAAQSFDPTWAEPALVEATLLAKLGRAKDAATAAHRATELEPRSWSVQYRAAPLLEPARPAAAAAAMERARRLNPRLAAKQSAAAPQG